MKKLYNIKCSKVEEKFIFLLDGELDPADKKVVSDHLETCPECAAKFAFLKKSLHTFEQVRSAGVDPFLYTRIKSRSERQNLHRPKMTPLYLAFAAVLIIGILSGFLLGKLTLPGTSDEVTEYSVAYLFNDEQMEKVEASILLD